MVFCCSFDSDTSVNFKTLASFPFTRLNEFGVSDGFSAFRKSDNNLCLDRFSSLLMSILPFFLSGCNVIGVK